MLHVSCCTFVLLLVFLVFVAHFPGDPQKTLLRFFVTGGSGRNFKLQKWASRAFKPRSFRGWDF